MAAAVALSLLGGSAKAEVAPVTRISADTPVVLAVGLSGALFPNGAATVYLARGDDLADALAGGTLTGGPILFVAPGGSLPASVRAEIDRLQPASVVALGGTAVVPAATLNATGRRTERLAGADRYATAAAIAQRVFPNGATKVYLTHPMALADAVAGAGFTDGPILPVPPQGAIPASITAELQRLRPTQVVALGGTGVVPDAVLSTAAASAGGASTDRLGGANRYETAVQIASRQFSSARTVYLAPGGALAAGVAAGSATDGPVFLVADGADPSSAIAAATAMRPSTLVVLGSSTAISRGLADRFAAALFPGTTPTTPPTSPTSNPAPTTSNPPSTMSAAEWEQRVFDLTNVERVKNGLPAFRSDACAGGVARDWSETMLRTQRYEHRSDWSFLDACRVAGGGTQGMAENIYMGLPGWSLTPEKAVQGWMDSPGHRANILNPSYSRLGVGFAGNLSSYHYATQNFWG